MQYYYGVCYGSFAVSVFILRADACCTDVQSLQIAQFTLYKSKTTFGKHIDFTLLAFLP